MKAGKTRRAASARSSTEWHRVTILSDGLVTIAEKYLAKGAKVYIEGKLETRKYTDRDNVERYTTEIVLRPYSGELILLDRKDDAASADPGNEDEPPHADNDDEEPAQAKKEAGQKG